MTSTTMTPAYRDVTKTVTTYVCAVGLFGASSSEVYLAVSPLGISLDLHRKVSAELVRQGLFTERSHFFELTPKGRAMHDEIAGILFGAR